MTETTRTYREITQENPDGQWELFRGHVRQKPATSFDHNDVMTLLAHQLLQRLDISVYRVRVNAGRVRAPQESYYIPDVAVIPLALAELLRGQPDVRELYTEPLPFVAEVWSPSTGDYDVDAKLPGYRARGDAEIWRIHPFTREVTAWRRHADGTYDELTVTGGTLTLSALPDVTIDLATLFL